MGWPLVDRSGLHEIGDEPLTETITQNNREELSEVLSDFAFHARYHSSLIGSGLEP